MGKRIKNKLPPFVAVFREMLNSAAWENIGNPARVAYIHIKSKCVSQDPGEITLSFDAMEKFMTRQTYARALRELEKFGFIKRTQRGGLYRKRNYFLLIDEWKKVQDQVGKMEPAQVSKVLPVSDAKRSFK
jgi:hypothetical protein